jgi:delta-aminolevulinic acid dehydratase/porphobilinogen synthase
VRYRKDGSCIDYDSNGNSLIKETCDMIGKSAAAHTNFGADIISLPEMTDGQGPLLS